MKSKDLKSKRNNKKIGKKDKKLELIFFIKYLMIDKRKLKNIKRLNNKSLDRNSLIKLKFKRESNNMKLNNKLVEMHNMKDPNFNKENYFNR